MDKYEIAKNIIELNFKVSSLIENALIGADGKKGCFSLADKVLFLIEMQGVCHPQFLIRELGIKKTNLAIICNGLEKDGLLTKNKLEGGDGRAIYYTLTEKGKAYVDACYKKIYNKLNDSKEELVGNLSEIVKNLKN